MERKLIVIDDILKSREVDAGLHLLERLLGLPPERLGEKRAELVALRDRVQRRRDVTECESVTIASAYRSAFR